MELSSDTSESDKYCIEYAYVDKIVYELLLPLSSSEISNDAE